MLCEYTTTDYIIKSIKELQAQKKLEDGYRLWGPPIIFRDCESNSKELVGYQAIVKIEEFKPSEVPFKLKLVEVQCIELLIDECSVKEIGKTLNRSPRYVEDILDELRYKFNCQRSMGIVARAYDLGFIKNRRVVTHAIINNKQP